VRSPGCGVSMTMLGQSGIALRAPTGELLLVDPYFSDYLREELGLARIAPVVLDPETTAVTTVVSTHWHPDHLDPPTCRTLARSSPAMTFLAPPGCVTRLLGWGIAEDRVVSIERGGTATSGPFTVHAEYARHEVPGWITEDAVSLVLDVSGIRIYHSGDTEYDARLRAARRLGPFAVGLFVINGTGGNMNALEAAFLAHQLGPALAVPVHYDLWAPEGYGPGATLDPGDFTAACKRLGGPSTRVLGVGETLEL